MQLKILSWNIWYDDHFDEVSRFLKDTDADIIGLQEVVPNDPTRDTIGLLSNLGYNHVFTPVLTLKDGRMMSNAVFSKYPIVGNKTHVLSEAESRNAVQADIKIEETILSIFSTHLLHTHQQPSETQELQAENLLKVLPQEKTIVMGDFNATPESIAIQKIRKVMADSELAPIPTVNATIFDCSVCDSQTMANTRLDYIFTTKDIKSHSFKVNTPAGSDHLSIQTIIEI